VHVRAVDYLYAMFAGYEVLNCQDFVGGKGAEDMREPQGFGVALSVQVVAD
jgi:hypothetical protein